jgi:4-nitrophenyl phosphatase
LNGIKHLLLDMDGVVVRGAQPTPGAVEFFARLHRLGIGFAVLTNNSTRTPDSFAERFRAVGFPIEPREVFNSARATVAYLQSVEPGASVYAIGEEGLLNLLTAGGFRLTEDAPRFVVVGLDRQFTYGKLATAQRALRAGARLVATNPDSTFPGEAEILPGAGSLVAAVETAGGARATVIGKPFPAMFHSAMAELGATAETTAIVGDRLDTDIAGGAQAGLTTILVLTGVTDTRALAASTIRPDLVYPSLIELGDALERAAPAPAAGAE